MKEKIRVLILEDNRADVELMKLQLRKASLEFIAESCQDKKAFLSRIDTFVPDIILADFSLPDFDGLSAIALARQRIPHLPAIIVSGAIGEEAAIEALKAGATDYVLKTRLSRLGPAVKRAIQEAKEVFERKRAEEDARNYAEKLRARNQELERFNRAMVDRELRIIELKRQINELMQRLGEEPIYPLDFAEKKEAGTGGGIK